MERGANYDHVLVVIFYLHERYFKTSNFSGVQIQYMAISIFTLAITLTPCKCFGNSYQELRHLLPVQRQILNCAKLVRRAVPTSSRKFVRKMCGGIQKCAEIVRNLRGGAPAQVSQKIGVGPPRMCVHKFRAIFATNLNFSLRPSCTGKECLKPKSSTYTFQSFEFRV